MSKTMDILLLAIGRINAGLYSKLSDMKSTILSRTVLVATALLFSILACYGQNDPTEQVVGTWIKVVDTNTITLSLTADNKSQVEFTGDEVLDVWGSYEISGTQITFNDEGGEYGANEAAVYEFKVSDTAISFTEVNDPVGGRRMLVEGSWSKAAAVEK